MASWFILILDSVLHAQELSYILVCLKVCGVC